MADIELVIKIPEKVYKALTHTEFDANLVVDELPTIIEADKSSEDCISREDLKVPRFIMAENDYQKGWNDALNAVYENASSIQQKKGRWITNCHGFPPEPTTVCSECGFDRDYNIRPSYYHKIRFCPICGAEMESEEK